jgi:hypothetical protein
MVHAVEEALDVSVHDEDVAEFAALADAGDGAVHGTAGAVAVAALQELLLEGAGCVRVHDHSSNGTATLFAALNSLDGTVIGMCHERHRHQEWVSPLLPTGRSTA